MRVLSQLAQECIRLSSKFPTRELVWLLLSEGAFQFNSTSIGNYVSAHLSFSEQCRHCMVLTNAIATRKRRSRWSIVAASTDSSLAET
jgi:hypothetical protein